MVRPPLYLPNGNNPRSPLMGLLANPTTPDTAEGITPMSPFFLVMVAPALRSGELVHGAQAEVLLPAGDLAGLVLGEVLLRILRGDGREQEDGALHADGLVVVGPVGRGGDAALGGELQSLDAAADLVHVAADGRGVVESELELLLGVDDEHRTDGEGEALVVEVAGVEHVVLDGDAAVGVADDGEVDGDAILAVRDDVLEPGV
eukprot:CAMPEP_0182869000 /NCGR_PEP_ID=MMETSP0034_2-20130328/9659_1 /TAXON_ID=156128 /ORGANISM="Nephroselmis pyriformis, Strain CCMP717" /LENGTH=203 /DNA_ID=CAMNT_0025001435 /DNA_START=99 /DNA_END=707 /DNA_ORIENTATION=-